MNEHVETLRASGFGVVEDGHAVIVISEIGRQEHASINYSDSPTIARRYESAELAIRILLGEDD